MSEEPTLEEGAEVARSLGSLPDAKGFIRDVRRRERERMESAAPDLRDALQSLLGIVTSYGIQSDMEAYAGVTRTQNVIEKAEDALEAAGVEP